MGDSTLGTPVASNLGLAMREAEDIARDLEGDVDILRALAADTALALQRPLAGQLMMGFGLLSVVVAASVMAGLPGKAWLQS